MAAPENLTPQDLIELQAYINAMKELEAVEPEYLPPLESANWPGQEWEAWNKKCVDLNNEYHDVIVKALLQSLRLGDTWEDSPQSVAAILDALVMGNYPKEQDSDQISLFSKEDAAQRREIAKSLADHSDLLLQRFLPMLNGNPTNAIMGISAKYLDADGITGIATYKKNGQTIRVKDFSDVSAHLGTSAKKLMDTSVLYLTSANFYGSGTVNPTAIIPLADYWRAQGYPVDPTDDTPEEQARVENLVKWLKKNTRADCQAIKSISWEGYTGTGKNKTQEASYQLVSGWRFLRGNRLKVNFDIDLATYLIHAYQMQFPVVLLALDNRKPNSYVIGRKIAFHHSIDNNAIAGTDNTISVKALLAAAPEIPSYEVVTSKRQGGWKTRIKKRLEAALDDNITVGYLLRWEYRDPKAKTVTRYTPETAAALCWEEYYSLVVDFTLTAEPDQEKRRAKRATEKAAAAERAAKKRGRPKKTEKKG